MCHCFILTIHAYIHCYHVLKTYFECGNINIIYIYTSDSIVVWRATSPSMVINNCTLLFFLRMIGFVHEYLMTCLCNTSINQKGDIVQNIMEFGNCLHHVINFLISLSQYLHDFWQIFAPVDNTSVFYGRQFSSGGMGVGDAHLLHVLQNIK